jgi:hypothetical protein
LGFCWNTGWQPWRQTSVDAACAHLFVIATTRTHARDEEDQAADLHNRIGNATDTCRDEQEAARARERARNTESVRADKVVAAPAYLFAMEIPWSSDGEDEAVRFRERDGNVTSTHGDGCEAGRANEHGSNIARAREGDANIPSGRKCNNVAIAWLYGPAKKKIAVKPRTPASAVAWYPRPLLFFSVSTSVEIFRLRATTPSSAEVQYASLAKWGVISRQDQRSFVKVAVRWDVIFVKSKTNRPSINSALPKRLNNQLAWQDE